MLFCGIYKANADFCLIISRLSKSKSSVFLYYLIPVFLLQLNLVKMNKFLSLFGFGFLVFAQFVWVVHSGFPPIAFTDYTKVFQQSKDRVLTFVRSPPLSFTNAMAACAGRAEILAEFKDAEDIQFLNEALKSGSMPDLKDGDYIYAGGIYVGDNNAGTKGYQWFESGLDVTLWGPGQPNKLVGSGWDEDCLVVYKVSGQSKGDWAIGDHTCAPKRPFICSAPQPHA